MNISVMLITIVIFLDNIGYAIYEFKNKNKFCGVCVIILSVLMLIFVNYLTIRYK